MQIIVSFELYIDIGTRYIPNVTTCSVYHWNQNRNKADDKLVQCRGIYLFMFIYI